MGSGDRLPRSVIRTARCQRFAPWGLPA